MNLYRIRNWEKHFENNRTKELKKLTWVPVPNKHDGDGFSELLDHPNGPAHYGAWCILVQIASKCDPRGTLLRDTQEPHTSHSLARMSHLPAGLISEAIQRLVSIGWLETCEDVALSCGNVALSCDNVAPSCGLPEGNGREGNGTLREREKGEKSASEQIGEEEDLDIPDALVDVCRGLRATGKFGELQVEHIVLVNREFPKANLAERWKEIAIEAKGVTGTITSTLPWLRKTVSRLEVRNITAAPAEAAAEYRPTFKGYTQNDE